MINLLCEELIGIGVNKLDCDAAGYMQERYDEIANVMMTMLVKAGWKKDFTVNQTPVLPIPRMDKDFTVEKIPVLPISS